MWFTFWGNFFSVGDENDAPRMKNWLTCGKRNPVPDRGVRKAGSVPAGRIEIEAWRTETIHGQSPSAVQTLLCTPDYLLNESGDELPAPAV